MPALARVLRYTETMIKPKYQKVDVDQAIRRGIFGATGLPWTFAEWLVFLYHLPTHNIFWASEGWEKRTHDDHAGTL